MTDTWGVAEAKAHFSELVDKARTEGPQHVNKNGREAVVVLSARDFNELTAAGQGSARSMVDVLLDPSIRLLDGLEADELFARDKDHGRPVDL